MKTKVTLKRIGDGDGLSDKNYRITKFVGNTKVNLGALFFRVGDHIDEDQAAAICAAYPSTAVIL